MWAQHFKQIKIAFISLLLFTLLTGFIYPLIVTGISHILFPWRTNGSLIEHDGKIQGSQLIGQYFTDPKYFWGRPSNTSTFPYNAASSGASNWGPSNPDFLAAVKERVAIWKNADPHNHSRIPAELVMGSGSGLDPHISTQAAYYQAARIAAARGISEEDIKQLIIESIQNKSIFILGEERVNILEINLALDALYGKTTP